MTDDEVVEIDLTDGTVGRHGPTRTEGEPRWTLPAAVEALLIVADAPVPAEELAAQLAEPVDAIERVLRDLAARYERERRGFELREIGGGWRYHTARHVAPVVEASLADRQSSRLSRAAVETLAIVAYRQPISRARIAAIRGVNVDGVVKTLLARDLIAEVAVDPQTGAALLGSTGYFLERLGLRSLADLPPVADHLPDDAVLDDFADPLQ